MQKYVVYTQHTAYYYYIMAQIYNRIKILRTERGLSRQALASRMNVNAQTIGYLERGDYNASLELAMKLARFFDVPVETLFSFKPFPSLADQLRNSD